ncbi:hypothetical protein KI688_003035 [Linnemannia hyalina]|uniref:Uncharacterized protein n=1 Tax=Linnemannia hyalina TaxID=64524 RepID=A0A9P7XPG1_9FUNG|nr:hypothetical protein KI688_003035 [Linnemannia hyalina]
MLSRFNIIFLPFKIPVGRLATSSRRALQVVKIVYGEMMASQDIQSIIQHGRSLREVMLQHLSTLLATIALHGRRSCHWLQVTIWLSEEFPGQMSRLITEVDRYLEEYHCIVGQWTRVGLYNVRYVHNWGDWYVWRNLFLRMIAVTSGWN